MQKLIKKLDSLYDFSNMTYTYKIGYYADLFAVVFMNILGIAWLSAPVIALASLIYNTPFSQYQTITLDHFFGLCIGCFFYFGISQIFFMNNKSRLSWKLVIFGYSWMGLALVVMLCQLIYNFIKYNYLLIINPSDHMGILYLDFTLVALAVIFYICTNKKVHQFFDKHLTKY